MGLSNLKITLLEHTPFLREDGTFDLKRAMNYSGKIGGICYNEEGLMASFAEPDEKTEKRITSTTSGEHQSVYEHINIGMYLANSSKILLMVLNGEHQYSTSERSLRYTAITSAEKTTDISDEESSNLTSREIELYDKWYNILLERITVKYGDVLKPFKIKTLAKENARYMASIFVNTEMVHTIPLAQLNRVVCYMRDFINKEDKDAFEERLSIDFQRFIDECTRLNLLDERLQSNRKHRKLAIFGENLASIPEEYGVSYSTTYVGSFVEFAQAERHRKGEYQLERDPKNGFFVPPIIAEDPDLKAEWLADIESVKDCFPQGELVTINERGSFDSFIMKLKERDCSAAQLEIFRQVNETKGKYYDSLKEQDHPYVKKLEPYMKGRRCTYRDFDCPTPCGFKEGIDGTRKV